MQHHVRYGSKPRHAQLPASPESVPGLVCLAVFVRRRYPSSLSEASAADCIQYESIAYRHKPIAIIW